jgi:hypothetical protein
MTFNNSRRGSSHTHVCSASTCNGLSGCSDSVAIRIRGSSFCWIVCLMAENFEVVIDQPLEIFTLGAKSSGYAVAWLGVVRWWVCVVAVVGFGLRVCFACRVGCALVLSGSCWRSGDGCSACYCCTCAWGKDGKTWVDRTSVQEKLDKASIRECREASSFLIQCQWCEIVVDLEIPVVERNSTVNHEVHVPLHRASQMSSTVKKVGFQ